MSSPNLPDFCLCSPLALRPVFLPHPPTLDTQTAQTSRQSLDPQVFNHNQFLNLLWLSLLIRQRKTSDTSPCHVCVFMVQNLPEQVTVCWNNDHVTVGSQSDWVSTPCLLDNPPRFTLGERAHNCDYSGMSQWHRTVTFGQNEFGLKDTCCDLTSDLLLESHTHDLMPLGAVFLSS